jgi:hypothetical protein
MAMDHTTWNTDETLVHTGANGPSALRYFLFTPTASTIPTLAVATDIWQDTHAEILGKLSAVGLTPSDTAGEGDTIYLAGAEAMIVSGESMKLNDSQLMGENYAQGKQLVDRGWSRIEAVCEQPEVLSDLGASLSSTDARMAGSHVTDFENSGIDSYTSSLEVPLPNARGRLRTGGDL